MKSSEFAKTKFSPGEPHEPRASTVKLLKLIASFNMRYSTNTVGEQPTETRSNASGYNGVFFMLKSSNLAKNKISPDEPP